MAVKFKLKKGDSVKIIAGDDKGKISKILADEKINIADFRLVLPKEHKVICEGINLAKKAVKPSEKYQNGGFVNKEVAIDISNVAKVEG